MAFIPLSQQGVKVVTPTFAASPMPQHPSAAADDWTVSALCAQTSPELWYPEKGESVRPAKQICGRCPVKAPCLEYALDTADMFGIWGATTEGERKKLRAARRAVDAA